MIFRKLFFLFIIIIFALIVMSNVNVEANEFDDEHLIITNINMDDDYSNNVVIIVLKHRISLEFIDYTTEDFSEIDCVKVEDLTEHTTEIIKDEIIANKTGDYSKLKERIDKNMLVDIDKFHRILCLYLNSPGKENVIDAIRKLEKRNDIISAEPDYIEHLEKATNDEYFISDDQWGLNGEFGINAFNAWNYSVGNSNLLVGVIDSGIDSSHPDLVNNINDDLHRDYVDHPWYTTYKNVLKSDLEDLDGHGTHVAGIIGAQGNNSIGVSGTSWNIKLVSLRVFESDNGSAADVKRAIDYATDVNINILNYSGGGTNDHNGRKASLQNYPGLFVCAAGNDNQDNDLNDHFPSNYNFSNLIAVGAINNNNGFKRLSSNYGQTTVDIFAPGGNIISTYPLDLFDEEDESGKHVSIGYYKTGGTSMATPFVTGVAALMLSINPNLTPQQIKATIMNNATKYSALDDLCVCEGRLDAYKAVVAVALDTETISGNIKIVGFVNGYTPSSNMELTIPERFAQVSSTYGTQEQEVQIIDNLAFSGYADIKSVKLPNTMTAIGSYAFEGCTSLENVTILKEKAPITNLGLHAFDNCASNLTITVPINRLCQYKNTPLWSIYKNKIVPSSNIDSSINIDCMSNFDETVYLNAGYNKLYELNVECNGWYTISCSSGARFNIYNSNMEIIASSNNLYELTLSEGIYYIDVEWEDIEDYGNVTLHFYNKGISVTDNINNNILPHLHSTGTNYKAQLKYYHNQGAGYYKFSLSATSSTSDPVNYHYGAITMYTDYNRNTIMNKYSDNNYTLQAKSLEDENSMIIYLPSNGYYYFDINMGTNNLSSLVLNITSCPFSEMNLFDFNVSANDTETIINTNIEGDYFKKISLKQTGKFIISSTYTDNDIDNISLTDVVVVVSKVTYKPSTNTYSFTKIYSVDYRETIMLDPNYVLPLPLEIVLEAGTYYIGYFNNIDCANIKIDFERIITGCGSYNLITDPDMYNDYGSEVRFNNGAYLGTTLTVGFTRFIYLNWDYNLPSYSRLDYYFYSSNESVVTISEYGTLLGRSAGSVKIMAVYKSNPSIVFVKQFTVLADNRVNDLIIYDIDNIVYTGSGQLYQIELDDYNSYFPQVTLYNWSIDSSYNNYNYSISEWGTISLSGEDIIVIEGVSKLNSKLKIRLTLTVT